MKKTFRNIKNHKLLCLILLSLVSCEIVDNDPDKHVSPDRDSTSVTLEEVARILSAIPLETAQLQEVHDAVTSSSGNGYDEEYTMRNLFSEPGSGVGYDRDTRAPGQYARPLRDLIEEYVVSSSATRSSASPEDFLCALEESDVQIYWPFSEDWDGDSMPVVTFDPGDNSDVNIGYEVLLSDDGFRHVNEVVVDEEMARERPVWVVNRNSDAGYTSLEMLRREDPDWGEGGGDIIVKPSDEGSETRALNPLKMLVLKEFTMKRNYDSWFAGASEFFVKIASLDDFTASTEAELRLYDPMVTDFMIVVKRNQVGIPQPLNVMLVSEMKRHLIEHSDDCEGECLPDCRYAYDEYAFMISEDDGGTREDWTCKGKVYVAGKSYGVEITIPLNTRDDVVWRGMLSGNSLERFNNKVNHFGDVDLMFEIIEY
ncbi:MAG: hypothetical protein J5976_04975 [Bacteroidales bacterium]|nr:hypothetical protein [Bacteroidales bacterium]